MPVTTRKHSQPRENGGAASRAMKLEIAAVLLLICMPHIGALTCRLFWGRDYEHFITQSRNASFQTTTTFDIDTFDSVFYSLRYIPIILFIMWRSGDSSSHFGVVKPAYRRDILVGLALSLIVAVLGHFVHMLSNEPDPWPGFFLPAAVPWHRAVLILGESCAIGLSEELWGRAYLIPRFEAVTGATWKAVLLSVVVFGFVHLFKGLAGVTSAVISASVWGTAFCLTRRIWPVATSHAITDFIIGTHLGANVGL